MAARRMARSSSLRGAFQMLLRKAPAPRATRTLVVSAGDVQMRLDRFVRAQLPSIPQSLIQKLTRTRAIAVEEPGQPKRKAIASERVSAGMLVHVPEDVGHLQKPTRRIVRARV